MRPSLIRQSAASTSGCVTVAFSGLGNPACRKLAISPGGLSTRHTLGARMHLHVLVYCIACIDTESTTHDAGLNRGAVKTRSSSADEALSALEVLRRENELLRRTIEAADGSISDLTSEVGLKIRWVVCAARHITLPSCSWSVLAWRYLLGHRIRTAQSLGRKRTMILPLLCGCPRPQWLRVGDW